MSSNEEIIGLRLKISPNHETVLSGKGFTIGKVLNTGKYGSVCSGTMTVNKKQTEIAVKVIDLMATSAEYRERFLPRELYFLRKLKHKYIIETFEIILITNTVYVFMELASGGDIMDMIMALGATPEPKAKPLFKGVATALEYIHSNGYAHRDIKCENILLNKERTIAKLTDFGFSTTCFDRTTGRRRLSDTYCGSPNYNAPEVLAAKPYDPMKSDVWSMGVVLYVMVNNYQPFTEEAIRGLVENPTKQIQLDFKNKDLSKECKDLIQKIIEVDKNKRFTMAQVLAHQWLK